MFYKLMLCEIHLLPADPGEHVSHLYEALKHEEEEHKATLKSITELENKHREELRDHVNKIIEENEEKLTAEIEKMRCLTWRLTHTRFFIVVYTSHLTV